MGFGKFRKELADQATEMAVAMVSAKIKENIHGMIRNIVDFGDPTVSSSIARKLQLTVEVVVPDDRIANICVSAKWKFTDEHPSPEDFDVVDLAQPVLPFKEEGEA